MCGRYTLATPEPVLQDVFELGVVPELVARYNISPTQLVPVIYESADEGDRRMEMLRWGLIPSWAKDPGIGNRMINARGETVAEKPAFRAAFKRRRCLVPADGFYEWKKAGKKKQPYLIYLADRVPFAFAGLWESWTDPEGSDVRTCTIITTEANELMQPLHDRMPVILHRESYAEWLSPAVQDTDHLQTLLCPYEAKLMACHPVSTNVNNPRNEGADIVTPIQVESQGELG